MKIQINGQEKEIDVKTLSKSSNTKAMDREEGILLSDVIESLNLKDAKFAIELNGRVVLHEKSNAVFLSDGDKIEFMHFIGGG